MNGSESSHIKTNSKERNEQAIDWIYGILFMVGWVALAVGISWVIEVLI